MTAVTVNPILGRREALGLTQAEAAARCDVDLSTFRNWECGRSCPQHGKVKPLAKGLEWSLEEATTAVAELQRRRIAE